MRNNFWNSLYIRIHQSTFYFYSLTHETVTVRAMQTLNGRSGATESVGKVTEVKDEANLDDVDEGVKIGITYLQCKCVT